MKRSDVGDKAEIEAIREVVAAYVAADDNADIEGMLAHVIDDAVLLPHGYPSAEGKEDIRSWYEEFIKMTPDENYYRYCKILEVTVHGDVAHVRREISQTMEWLGGRPLGDQDQRELMTLAKQPDGAWKITHYISNISHPLRFRSDYNFIYRLENALEKGGVNWGDEKLISGRLDLEKLDILGQQRLKRLAAKKRRMRRLNKSRE